MRKIPVFVSCPTMLSKEQEKKRKIIIDILTELQLEPRALGRSDYPTEYPLKEVYIIAKHCSGGIILGFEQLFIKSGKIKRKTKEQTDIRRDKPIRIPTPWNHLESGILFGLKLPLLIFKEKGITGGVFDYGITDVFIHKMPSKKPSIRKLNELRQVFLDWFGKVSTKYHNY